MTENHITEYLCINCPLGCHLEVEEDEKDNIVDVRGWGCKRGDKYARQEHTDPRRMVTTTVSMSARGMDMSARVLMLNFDMVKKPSPFAFVTWGSNRDRTGRKSRHTCLQHLALR